MDDPKSALRAAVTQCFPPASRVIHIPDQADLVLAISWPLKNDLLRPRKRSKIIRLTITSDIIDAYALGSGLEKVEVEQQLTGVIGERLAGFDPDHQQSPDQDPLVVAWEIEAG